MKMETTILGFRVCWGLGLNSCFRVEGLGTLHPIMENEMREKMENLMQNVAI